MLVLLCSKPVSGQPDLTPQHSKASKAGKAGTSPFGQFHHLDDVRYLLRHLDVSSVGEAMEIVTRYFDERQLLPKTRLILEELLPR